MISTLRILRLISRFDPVDMVAVGPVSTYATSYGLLIALCASIAAMAGRPRLQLYIIIMIPGTREP